MSYLSASKYIYVPRAKFGQLRGGYITFSSGASK